MEFFFFKQKTAYEMLRSLVGSEMCIRDRVTESKRVETAESTPTPVAQTPETQATAPRKTTGPVSYTHLTLPTIYSV